MFILGLAIFLFGFTFFIVWMGGDLLMYLDPPSLLVIAVPLLAVLTATKSFKVFYGGLKAMVQPKEPLSEELRGQASSLYRLLSKTTALASGIGVLIAAIIIVVNIGDPFMMGKGIAVAIISVLYGLILIAAVFEPVVFNLKKRRQP
jgi:flagellar motor component MotA